MGRDGDGDGVMSNSVGSVRFNFNFLAAIVVSLLYVSCYYDLVPFIYIILGNTTRNSAVEGLCFSVLCARTGGG